MTTHATHPGSKPRPKRQELQRILLSALTQGPETIPQQIQSALALSKMQATSTATRPYIEKTLPPESAALVALANMAEVMDESEISKLLEAAEQISDVETQLQIITRLALRLPSQHYQPIVTHVWEFATHVKDPVIYTRIMFQLTPLLTLMHDEPAVPPVLLELIALAQAIGHDAARIRSLSTLAPLLPYTMRLRILHRILDDIDRLHDDQQRSHALTNLADHITPDIEDRVLRSADAIRNPAERARAFIGLARYLPITLRGDLTSKALTSINTIPEEQERAEVLIGFAPYLEYVTDGEHFPLVLERSLAIVMSIGRRHLRAQALVALAPHLTLDLQGEALAAVHSLKNEHDRAMLLAQIAPTLPPNMLVASLAVAHSMQAQDARVHALIALAQYVPENAYNQTVLDALAAASNLPHPYERVVALMSIVDSLPEHLKEQTYTQALETTRLIENEPACARALSALGPHLPPHLLLRALDIATQLRNPPQRLIALSGITPYLQTPLRLKVFRALLVTIHAVNLEYKRARALADIAPLLPAELIPPALTIARGIMEPFDRVIASTALIQYVSVEQRRKLIAECWQLIKKIDNGYDAASALAAIAPLLPPSAANDLAQATGMMIGSIMDDYDQASAITLVAPILATHLQNNAPASDLPDRYAALESGIRATLRVSQQLLRVQLLTEGAHLWSENSDLDRSYRFWREVLQKLAELPYADMLLCLGALVPVIHSLGGSDAVRTVVELLDVR